MGSGLMLQYKFKYCLNCFYKLRNSTKLNRYMYTTKFTVSRQLINCTNQYYFKFNQYINQ